MTQLMRRDFQFRRQAIVGLLLLMFWFVRVVADGWRIHPFSREFTTTHLLPHMIGVLLFFVCAFLPYGNDYKGGWTFLLVPERVLGRFARGIHAGLWIPMVVGPHLAMVLAFAWPWGLWRAALFTAYSFALSSLYLAALLRTIDSIPFTQQVDPQRNATMMPLMILGGAAVAAAVGVQYFLVFRSPAIVAAVTLAAGAGAYYLTRNSLSVVETSMRYSLATLSHAAGNVYTEIGV